MKSNPQTEMPSDTIRLIRMPEVLEMTGLSRATIARRVKEGTFPKPVPLSQSTARSAPIGFLLDEVKDWINRQVAMRDKNNGPQS